MTILEFIQLSPKEIKAYLINHGITSHHDMASLIDDNYKNKGKNISKQFCDSLDLEMANCRKIHGTDLGSFTTINFFFTFDFQKNVKWKFCSYSADNDEIELTISGNSVKTLKVHSPHIDTKYHLWAENLNFFTTEECFSNFQYKMEIASHDNVHDALVEIEEKANDILPFIEYYLNTLKDGTYIDAYNKLHLDTFTVGEQKSESFYASAYIDTLYNVHRLCHYDMNILETMLLVKYMPSICSSSFEDGMLDNLDIVKTLEDAAERYVITDETRMKVEYLYIANDEFKKGINDLIDEISKKYNIHKSYFYGHEYCKVSMPIKVDNQLNLTKKYII